ncbi:MAG: hemolysin family protein [Acholeplasmatales bacterium]|jgi:putative hemolysin|nr:hemolysin family protein [Acholeplasmatales bacterium]
MNLIIVSLLILVLIVLNGIFASSEMALVSLSPSMIDADSKNQTKKTKLLLKFLNKPTRFLSTIQIGITFIGFINGVIAGDRYALALMDLFKLNNNANAGFYQALFMVIISILLVFFQVLFGELIPKRIAFAYPKKIAYAYIYLLVVVEAIFRPLVLLLTWLANIISKIFGVKKDENNENITEDELISMLNKTNQSSDITKEEVKLIENVFEFNDSLVSEIMTHRTKISGINIKFSKEKIWGLVASEKYSRYPVYESTIDHIVGVVNLKDLLPFFIDDSLVFDIKKIMKKPIFVPESQKIKTLFETMRRSRNHIAIVIDEFSGTAGLLTLEDIVEEIFGNILDEYDEETNDIKKISENEFIINGLTNIHDVEKALEVELPNDDYDTLSGYILSKIEHLPTQGEIISFTENGLTFSVLKTKGQIIEEIKVVKQ